MEPTPIRCRIPELLKRLGKNQQWLADQTGISKSHISDIIHLRLDNIRIKRAKLIARLLRCKIDDLFLWEGDAEE